MKTIPEPIFIIGAGRSGTNILRDVLTKLPNMITWPCDEINLVFRHGNRNLPHDEFEKHHVNAKARNYIVKTFNELLDSDDNNNKIIVEKTCANSLRIPFLDEIFPKAKYIFIYRNGYDVAASASLRWKASIEIEYLRKKIKYVPKSDIPYYGLKFIKNRLYQSFSKEKKQRQWGPVYKGMNADINKLSIPEVAAKQWARCFEKAYLDLKKLPKNKSFTLAYEDFVGNPLITLQQIKNWNNYNWSESEMKEAVKKVRTTSVNKGKQFYDTETLTLVDKIIDPVMKNIYDKINKS
jgi:hypothetical protein